MVYHPVTKERKKHPTEPLTQEEHTSYRSSVGGDVWMLRTRMDEAASISQLQRKCASPTVEDLVNANAQVRRLKDSKDVKLRFKALPEGPKRQIIFHDAAKGHVKKPDYPQIGFIICLAMMNDETFDGPIQILDWVSRVSPRVCKSSLHCEAVAMAMAIEKAIRIAGWLTEFHEPWCDTKTLLGKQESGGFLPVYMVTDCKSLYDCIVTEMTPKPTDESSLLWLVWIRSMIENGTVNGVIWMSTQDQMSDALTKVMDNEKLRDLMQNGYLELKYSFFTRGSGEGCA